LIRDKKGELDKADKKDKGTSFELN
jgi:hypothetical protein